MDNLATEELQNAPTSTLLTTGMQTHSKGRTLAEELEEKRATKSQREREEMAVNRRESESERGNRLRSSRRPEIFETNGEHNSHVLGFLTLGKFGRDNLTPENFLKYIFKIILKPWRQFSKPLLK